MVGRDESDDGSVLVLKSSFLVRLCKMSDMICDFGIDSY
jgi:hypothetical protein